MSKLSREEQNKLIVDNLALITYLIKKYIYIGSDEFEDLFQEGALYMTQAARNFNPDLGYKFSTYASNLIVGGLHRYKRDKSNDNHGLRIARSKKDILNKLKRRQITGDDFSDQSLADELGVSVKDVEDMKMLGFKFLDQEIICKDGNLTFGDSLGECEVKYTNVEAEIDCDILLEEAKKKLNQTYYDILEEIIYSYMIGGKKVSQNELGIRYGISQAQISRNLKQIKKVIRSIVNE